MSISTDEIQNLQRRASDLKRQLEIQTSTLLSSSSTRDLVDSSHAVTEATKDKLRARSLAQEAHHQQCLYRACASITTFKVKDPDPNAVDGGSVLGLRIEIMERAKFRRPYYVLLNRPWADHRGYLRVHRHTVPVFIPLAGLAARYLPAPPEADGADGEDGDARRPRRPRRQDLTKFARSLRKEIVRYHNRQAVVSDLRQAVGLEQKSKKGEAQDDNEDGREEEVESPFEDIKPVDAQVKQVSVEWKDGRTGRLVMNNDGEVMKMAVFGVHGRDRDTARKLLRVDETVRMEEVGRRLADT